MQMPLSGSTRLCFIVGDPIAQVKSPHGVTKSLQEKGKNTVCLPAHVAPDDLADFMRTSKKIQNVDSLIMTVPHKIAVSSLCDVRTERATFLGAVNTIRRTKAGWYGDMCDGEGYLQALRKKNVEITGKKVLLVGVGGAGSAIALALVQAGVGILAIHELNVSRRDALIARLSDLGLGKLEIGTDDPTGFDIVINATPVGMKADDPSPLKLESLTAQTVVGDVITSPAVTPLLHHAQALGCVTVNGGEMFEQVCILMVNFLLET